MPNTTYTYDDIMSQLKALGDEKVRKQNAKQGAHDNQFGVKLGDIRKIAKKIKTDHKLGMHLWESGNIDARFLAVLIIEPEKLSKEELDTLVKSMMFSRVADWVNSYIIKNHPDKESLRLEWMESDHPMAARAGWNLTASRIAKGGKDIDIAIILDRIEVEMGSADPLIQWTMNFALAETGIHFPEHRERAVTIGEKLGIYRDYPVSKGCTSPFAPIWIKEMIKRQGTT